jgi:hypothetical protein
MIPISARHSIPLTLAIALLAVPVAYHAIARPMTISCANPSAIVGEKRMPDVIEQEPATSESHGFIDGIAGELSLPGDWKQSPQFRLTRTYDLGRYYFIPMDNFTNMFPEDRLESLSVEVDGVEVPLHLRLDESEGIAVTTVYFYIIDGKPVANPFSGSLAQAFPQLRRGIFPLTMILVNARSERVDAEISRATLIDWAKRAWTAYDETCNDRGESIRSTSLESRLYRAVSGRAAARRIHSDENTLSTSPNPIVATPMKGDA